VAERKDEAPREAPGVRVSSDEPLVLGEGEANYATARCPVCSADGATLRTFRLDIPYFGEILETVFLCAKCGFKHADTLIPRIQAPVAYSIRVEDEQDLFVRAVKSSSATVEIAELGLLWEPGPASIAEVTNVEGLLRRFEDAVRRGMALFATPQTDARGGEILAALHRAIGGKLAVTLSLKDPYGNSALIDPRGRATSRALTAEEAGDLPTGEYILEFGAGESPSLRRREDRRDA